MRLASPVALPRWHGSMRVRFALAIAGVVTLQLGVLAAMRFLTSPDGGDICRDIVAVHRMLAGQNPYMRITECGVLFNLPHPPAYLLLISPFTLLPLPWAAVVWNLATLVALAAGLALTARELGLAPTAPWRLGALLALGVFWPPLLGALLEAQISPLLLLLVILAWRAARRGQLSWAGAALGIAGALRLFPLLAVGYFALRREWRAVFAAAGAFAAVSLLPLPLISPAGYIAFATREAPASTAFWITHEHNSSAWGFANLLFVGHRTAPLFVGASDVARPLALVIIAVSVVALVWLTLARRHRSFAEDDLTFLAYLPVMLLASPLMWEHYFVILMLPLVVLGSRLGWLRRAPPRASVSAAHSVRWLVGSALALIELNYLLGLLPLPATLPWAFGPFFYALPTYALALFLIAFLWAGARVSGDAELAVSMPAVVRASV